MKLPDKIYLWECENQTSRNYFKDMDGICKSIYKKFGLVEYFNANTYINEAVLLDFIREKIRHSKTEECIKKAQQGNVLAQKDIQFLIDLERILVEKL